MMVVSSCLLSSGIDVITLFFFVIEYARVFDTGESFPGWSAQLDHLAVSHCRGRIKHSSLLCPSIADKEVKVLNIDYNRQYYVSFSLSLVLPQYKLDCLSLD
jgi:hypothetical protein